MCVVINEPLSTPKLLEFSFPQGSVLGPPNWKRYSDPIGVIARKHGLSFHLYADDTQLYVTVSPIDKINQIQAITKTESCIVDIKAWMTSNFLKFNENKTEVLVISKMKDIDQHMASIQI